MIYRFHLCEKPKGKTGKYLYNSKLHFSAYPEIFSTRTPERASSRTERRSGEN